MPATRFKQTSQPIEVKVFWGGCTSISNLASEISLIIETKLRELAEQVQNTFAAHERWAMNGHASE